MKRATPRDHVFESLAHRVLQSFSMTMKTLDKNQLESIHGGVRQGPNGEGCTRPFPKPLNAAPLPRHFPRPGHD